MHSAGGIPVSSDLISSQQGIAHKAKDAYRILANQDDSIMKVAEYLAFGSVTPQDINKLVFSDHTLPWIMCIYNRSQYLLGRMGIWMFGDAVSGSHDIAALLRSDYCNSWPFSTSNNTRN